jgi:hypothetical protein
MLEQQSLAAGAVALQTCKHNRSSRSRFEPLDLDSRSRQQISEEVCRLGHVTRRVRSIEPDIRRQCLDGLRFDLFPVWLLPNRRPAGTGDHRRK